MILDELLMAVFDEGAPDEGDDMMTVRFSDERIDRLYTQGCKHSEILPYQINAWAGKDQGCLSLLGGGDFLFRHLYSLSFLQVTA